mmetsp:Transcript_13234/g.55462  ORF Transcript_13234/g.55462 Transcript_13234/m.55462 type:complete len:273 (+) Transcript_13234:2639-3457(+)
MAYSCAPPSVALSGARSTTRARSTWAGSRAYRWSWTTSVSARRARQYTRGRRPSYGRTSTATPSSAARRPATCSSTCGRARFRILQWTFSRAREVWRCAPLASARASRWRKSSARLRPTCTRATNLCTGPRTERRWARRARPKAPAPERRSSITCSSWGTFSARTRTSSATSSAMRPKRAQPARRRRPEISAQPVRIRRRRRGRWPRSMPKWQRPSRPVPEMCPPPRRPASSRLTAPRPSQWRLRRPRRTTSRLATASLKRSPPKAAGPTPS